MSKVRVFSTKTCPYCVMLKDFLTQKKINFEDIDVGQDYNAAMEMIQISGQRGVPVADINGQVIVGFDEPRISKMLGIA
ncbi:glutaredoxin family protein [archaeon]|jgi:glutaredoxin-like YruB-family protein|nr:glutaredoxin family protein [archaeon]MBT4022552.1 glutaredoxin family protein [archaeon]MBT4272878.1 glutaredoxin family protein [archaeon]MBT4461678.1 glutaredoxin family protein [archaeon]MBT4857554.1 glutaredoxin family protein [archaeon]